MIKTKITDFLNISSQTKDIEINLPHQTNNFFKIEKVSNQIPITNPKINHHIIVEKVNDFSPSHPITSSHSQFEKIFKINRMDSSPKLTVDKINSSPQQITTQTHPFDNITFVYTDGSCIHNGKPNAKAGYGVFFKEGDLRNTSKPITGKQSNNVAELMAILEACEILKDDIIQGKRIIIYTDSEYAIKCFTTYGTKLSMKKFISDKPIPNLDLIKKGYPIFSQYPNVSLRHIESHTGKKDIHSLGNEKADELANMAIGITQKKDSSNKVYLMVSFGNKDEAKEMGALWDKKRKLWFIYDDFKGKDALISRFGLF